MSTTTRTAITFGDKLGTASVALRELGIDDVVALEDVSTRRFTTAEESLPEWLVASVEGNDIPDALTAGLVGNMPDRVLIDLPRGWDGPKASGRRAQLLNVLNREGYEVEAWLMDSANHGAAYSRKRLVMLGVHRDLSRTPVRPQRVRPQLVPAKVLPLPDFLPAWAQRRPGPALPREFGAPWGPQGQVGVGLTTNDMSLLLGLPEQRYAQDTLRLTRTMAEATPVHLYRSILTANPLEG